MTADLTPDERTLLLNGLIEWGGSSHPTDDVAKVIGFANVPEMRSERARLIRELRDGRDLSARDLGRALVATEIVFVSDSYGAGTEWEELTGWTDVRTLQVLRQLQLRPASMWLPPFKTP
jgi:hypothetical protein